MFNSEAEAWQNSLHQFIGITERNLQQLDSDRIVSSGINSNSSGSGSGSGSNSHNYNNSGGGGGSGGGSGGGKENTSNAQFIHMNTSMASSTNRNNDSTPSSHIVGESNYSSNSKQQPIPSSYESSLFTNDRDGSKKYDFLYKKNKYLQEKIKRLEDVNTELTSQAKENSEAIQLMKGEQKQDKQLIVSLANEFKQMKTQMELSKSSSSQYRNKTSTFASLSIIPEDDIMYDRVMARIEHEVKRSLSEYENQYARERAEFCKNLAEKSLIECKAVYQNSSVSNASIREMEKELIKVRTEVDRLKLKQGAMDQVVTEIKDNMNIREREAEERHRKALSGYKIDMNNTMDSLSRKVNDTLSSIQSNLRISEIPVIWKSIEDIVQNNKVMSRDNNNRLASIEGRCNEVDVRVKYFVSPEFVQDIFDGNVVHHVGKENTSNTASSSKVVGGFLSQSASSVGNGRSKGGPNAFATWKSYVESKLNGVESHLDRFRESQDKMLKASSLALLDCEKRIVDLVSQVQSLEDDTDTVVTKLIDAGKNTRKRLHDMSQKLDGISASKSALDDVIQAVDARSQDDASWSFNFKTSLEDLNRRIQYLETLPSISSHSKLVSQGHPMTSINKEEILASIDVKLKKYVADVEGLQIHMRRYVDDAQSQTTSDIDLKTSVYDEVIRVLQGKIANLEKGLELGMRSLHDENHNVYNELERLETSLSSSSRSRTPEPRSNGSYNTGISPNINYKEISSSGLHPNDNSHNHHKPSSSSSFTSIPQGGDHNNNASMHSSLTSSLGAGRQGSNNQSRGGVLQDVSSSSSSRSGDDNEGRDDDDNVNNSKSHVNVDEDDSSEFKAITNIMMTKKKFRDSRFGRK